MTAVLGGVIVAAAAALMCVCLCFAMSREERDRAYPVRPVPPRRPRTDLDSDPIWATTPMESAESPAELQAMRGLRVRYPEAYHHLLAEALCSEDPEHPDSAPDGDPVVEPDGPDHTAPADITTPHAYRLDRSPQVAQATEGDASRG